MRTVVAAVMLILPISVFAEPSPQADATKVVPPQGPPRTQQAPGVYPALDPSTSVAGDCARARKAGKTCVLDVPAEDVGGTTPVAGDIGTRVIIFHPETSLIRVRHDFIPEIVKTAEDL